MLKIIAKANLFWSNWVMNFNMLRKHLHYEKYISAINVQFIKSINICFDFENIHINLTEIITIIIILLNIVSCIFFCSKLTFILLATWLWLNHSTHHLLKSLCFNFGVHSYKYFKIWHQVDKVSLPIKKIPLLREKNCI